MFIYETNQEQQLFKKKSMGQSNDMHSYKTEEDNNVFGFRLAIY